MRTKPFVRRPWVARRARFATRLFAVLTAVWSVEFAGAHTAEFVDLGDLPGGERRTTPHRVSADGSTVVGVSDDAVGVQAFRWTRAGGMQDLGTSALFPQSYGIGVNADGSVVVGYGVAAQPEFSEALRWTAAGGVERIGWLSPQSPASSGAWDTSADGEVIVGRSSSSSVGQAFRWTRRDGMVGLGYLPGGSGSEAMDVSLDGSVVVGTSSSALGPQAFRWTSSGGMVGLGDLPGGMFGSYGWSGSADGSVVVGASYVLTSPGVSDFEAFRWTQTNGMVGLGDLPGGRRFSQAMSSSGDGSRVVGQSHDEQGFRAFVWDEAHGMRDLRAVLETEYGLDLSGWTLEEARDISPDGNVIVGQGTNPAGQWAGWRVALPEPAFAVVMPLLGTMLRRPRRELRSHRRLGRSPNRTLHGNW